MTNDHFLMARPSVLLLTEVDCTDDRNCVQHRIAEICHFLWQRVLSLKMSSFLQCMQRINPSQLHPWAAFGEKHDQKTGPILDGPDPLSVTVVRRTGFDVTIGQCVVSDRNLACDTSDTRLCPTLKSKSTCFHSYFLSHCRRTDRLWRHNRTLYCVW